jgi:DNA polymerase-1
MLQTIQTCLRKFPGTRRCIMVWDTGHSARRLSIFPEYKGTRGPDPRWDESKILEYQERKRRHQIFKELLWMGLPLFGLRNAILPCHEGDDIIGWFTRRLEEDMVVATEDKDMLQLVQKNVAVYQPIKDKFVTLEGFKHHAGVCKSLFLLEKAILGDKSDNIPGVPSVGKTTVKRFMETAEQLVTSGEAKVLREVIAKTCAIQAEADKRNAKRYGRLATSLDVVSRNLDLMDIRREVFTEQEEKTLHDTLDQSSGCFYEEQALKWLQHWEMNEMLDSWAEWSAPYRRLR